MKHFVDEVRKHTNLGATSIISLGYGEIGQMLAKTPRVPSENFRRMAELEAAEMKFNPEANVYGAKASEHKKRLKDIFSGYLAAGYSKEEVYMALVDNGMAYTNVGQGLCYGASEIDELDSSLPCIGSLRCNPARCKQAVVTKQHAPKWREVYEVNKTNLAKEEFKNNRAQMLVAMDEAKQVLESLGEEVEL